MSLFPSGPDLPDFKSLLIKGAYHPSAPIHLVLSHAAEHPGSRRALLITPSRDALAAALREHNDSWMAAHAGRGRVLGLAECTRVYYPPTPAHLAYLVSTLTTDVQSPDRRNVLTHPPSLVVLIELSAYFLPDIETNPTGHSWTLSSYLTLLVRTLASFAALSTNGTTSAPTTDISLALFDSHLDELKLPVLKHPTPTPGTTIKPSKLENVAVFVQKYFDLLAVFEEDDMVLNSSQEDENQELGRQKWNRMRIYGRGRDVPLQTYRWVERFDVASGGVVFVWER